MPAAATVDITHRCSLRCPFCIAASTRGNEEMSSTTFTAIARSLKGIGRLTLIGGEPFQHRHLPELVATARECAPEVEIFTNGLVLGTNPAQAPGRLTAAVPEASVEWLAVVLSVDPDHAGQMAPGRLAAAVDGLLEAERQGCCKARFSVTHHHLETGRYLDTDTITAALAEVSPALGQLFMDRLMEGRIQETFYFNSVICTQPEDEQATEPLRLEDLVESPEVAISFNDADRPVVFTSLAAMWSNSPPPATKLGGLDAATTWWAARLAEPAPPHPPGWEEALVHSPEDSSARERLLRAHDELAAILAWDGGLDLARRRLESTCALLARGLGDAVVRFGGEESTRQAELHELRGLLEWLLAHPDWGNSLVQELARWLEELAGDPPFSRRLVYVGDRELLGRRVPMSAGEEQPAQKVRLPGEPGFTLRDEFVLRPHLTWWPDGKVQLALPGIVPRKQRRTANEQGARAGFTRLAEVLVCLGGPELLARLELHLPAPLAALFALVRHRGDRSPVPLAENDLILAFAEATWDRNRQGADEENAELLALLLCTSTGSFPQRSCRAFQSRALTWLERLHKRQGLSHVTRRTLEDCSGRSRTPREKKLFP